MQFKLPADPSNAGNSSQALGAERDGLSMLVSIRLKSAPRKRMS